MSFSAMCWDIQGCSAKNILRVNLLDTILQCLPECKGEVHLHQGYPVPGLEGRNPTQLLISLLEHTYFSQLPNVVHVFVPKNLKTDPP